MDPVRHAKNVIISPRALILPMSSTSSNTQNLIRRPISSNFDRRVHAVGGCREVLISPDENGNRCDSQWMSSSTQLISKNFFLRCKSLSWAPFETGSHLSQLKAHAFRLSTLTSIHRPALVTLIGNFCFFLLRLTYVDHV
jgi:hypothetical protein